MLCVCLCLCPCRGPILFVCNILKAYQKDIYVISYQFNLIKITSTDLCSTQLLTYKHVVHTHTHTHTHTHIHGHLQLYIPTLYLRIFYRDIGSCWQMYMSQVGRYPSTRILIYVYDKFSRHFLNSTPFDPLARAQLTEQLHSHNACVYIALVFIWHYAPVL